MPLEPVCASGHSSMMDPGAPEATRYADRPANPLRRRVGVIAAVTALHLGVGLALVKGLAAAGVIADPFEPVSAFNVPLPPPAPSPSPTASGDEAAGKAAPEAARAKPKEAAAPKPAVPARARPAPPAASSGDEDRSGAGASGPGSGGGGAGTGTGSGAGQGGGMRALEKIAGEINSIRDYPRAGRDARIGNAVTIELRVGTDGRVRDCRVIASSGDAEADRITCRLATERFRFRPRLDPAGEPVEGIYRWRQRFFTP